MEYLSTSLHGMVLICDRFLEPSQSFLRFLCQSQSSLLVLELDSPRHTLQSWVPTHAQVVDAYGSSWLGVCECEHPFQEDMLLLVDGITRPVLELGISKVLSRLFEWRKRVRCVVFTLHLDCGVSAKDVDLLRGASNVFITASPTKVHILNKKAGGKVVQTHQRVLDWSKGTFTSALADEERLKLSSSSAGAVASAGAAQIELDSEQKSAVNRDRVDLPFIKTAVKGRMMFGEEPRDSDDEEASEEDPDADLDV